MFPSPDRLLSEESSQDPSDEDLRRNGPGAAVLFKNKVCFSPKAAETNLITFLVRSDVQKRRAKLNIPFFTAGSYIAVTRADKHSPSGETRFVGICIGRRNNGNGSTFVLRNAFDGLGVEEMFDLYSPSIRKIEVLKLQQRKSGKLYYLRDMPPEESTVDEDMQPDGNTELTMYKRKRR